MSHFLVGKIFFDLAASREQIRQMIASENQIGGLHIRELHLENETIHLDILDSVTSLRDRHALFIEFVKNEEDDVADDLIGPCGYQDTDWPERVQRTLVRLQEFIERLFRYDNITDIVIVFSECADRIYEILRMPTSQIACRMLEILVKDAYRIPSIGCHVVND